jgi:hypothetical protein
MQIPSTLDGNIVNVDGNFAMSRHVFEIELVRFFGEVMGMEKRIAA